MNDSKPQWALGLMSGTSLDGVDGALVLTDGEEIFEFGDSFFRPYTEQEAQTLHNALGLWPEDNPDTLNQARSVVEAAHLDVIAKFPNASVVGFHGQTLAHDPEASRTFQIGDGARIAQKAGKQVVWDFRSEDMRMGGQGAPLAPFYHFALAKMLKLTDPTVFLNLGGVGNVTWVDPTKAMPTQDGALLSFDTGPANAPINDLISSQGKARYDVDGAHAMAGTVDDALIERFLQHPYFDVTPPKSLDRNDFSDIAKLVEDMALNDAAATLTALIAGAARASVPHMPSAPKRWLVCGGGRKNPAIMAQLSKHLTGDVENCDESGIDGDMLEAQAFGYLAVRVLHGLPTSSRATTGCRQPVCGGIISG